MRGKELLHPDRSPEVVFAFEPLLGMRLAEQGEGADALHHVIFPAIGRLFVMDGEGSDSGQGIGALVEGLEIADCQVKMVREKWGELGGWADGEQPIPHAWRLFESDWERGTGIVEQRTASIER